jgi:hypothetical protein
MAMFRQLSLYLAVHRIADNITSNPTAPNAVLTTSKNGLS